MSFFSISPQRQCTFWNWAVNSCNWEALMIHLFRESFAFQDRFFSPLLWVCLCVKGVRSLLKLWHALELFISQFHENYFPLFIGWVIQSLMISLFLAFMAAIFYETVIHLTYFILAIAGYVYIWGIACTVFAFSLLLAFSRPFYSLYTTHNQRNSYFSHKFHFPPFFPFLFPPSHFFTTYALS